MKLRMLWKGFATRKIGLPFFISFVLIMIIISAYGVKAATFPDQKINKDVLMKKASGLQMPFIENQGQISDKTVRFYANTFAGTVFVNDNADLIYNLIKTEWKKNDTEQKDRDIKTKDPVIKALAIRECLENSTKSRVAGIDKSETTVNYFMGGKENWSSNISIWQEVGFGQVYKDIEMKLRAYGSNVEKIFTVYPGGTVSNIRLKIEGAQGIMINEVGELEVETELGMVRYTKPVAYQNIEGTRVNIAVGYSVDNDAFNGHDSMIYGFHVAEYDRTKPLIIDPLLASTFIGGSNNFEEIRAVAADVSGNIYVTGTTYSSNYPTTTGAYDRTYNGGSTDIFVSKLNSGLTTLLASSFLGGSADDYGRGIALDSSGNIYITGWSNSSNFPVTAGAYDTSNSSDDVFVLKLNSGLTSLISSTFVGGSSTDRAFDIGIDSSDNIIVTGQTSSSNFPTTAGAYDTSFNGGVQFCYCDAFISKLNGSLTSLLASTYIGGSSSDPAYALDIDSSDNIFIVGSTYSINYPTTQGSYDPSFDIFSNSLDAFVSKFNSTLSTLLASTFLGGFYDDEALACALDPSGNLFVAGYTGSSDFPVSASAYDKTSNGGWDVFVSKLDNSLSSLSASTFIGGALTDKAYSIYVDSSSMVYVAGFTDSSFPTTPGAYDISYNGGSGEAFVSKFNDNLSTLMASTFIGGSNTDMANAITKDYSGNVIVAGRTASLNYPIDSGAYDTSYNGATDAFISKLDGNLSAISTSDIDMTPSTNINFGNAGLGSSSEKTLTIINTGGSALVLGNIAQSNPVAAPFNIVSDSCSGQSITSAYCLITVRFSPDAAGGFNDTFDIPSNDPDENPVTIILNGTGFITYPDITVFPDHVNFGPTNIETSSDLIITVRNDGTADLVLGSIAQADPVALPFSIVTDDCSDSTLVPDSNCTISVNFAPEYIGDYSDIFDIPSNDPDEQSITVSISGSGVLPPDIDVSPNGLNLTSTEGGSTAGMLNITNSGTGNMAYNITKTLHGTGGIAQSSGNGSVLEGYNKMLSVDVSGKRKYKILHGAEYSKYHILVKFKPGLTTVAESKIHKKAGTSVIKRYKKIKIDKVEVADGRINEAINEYLKDDNVEYAEPDYVLSTQSTPNDPLFSRMYNLQNTAQTEGTVDADIDAPEAWDITTGGNVVVAVIDTGVNYNHEDMSSNMWTNPDEIAGNGIDDDANGYIDDYRGWDFSRNTNDPMDNIYHGTFCAGIIAAIGNNGIGVTGINWTAKIMPLKIGDLAPIVSEGIEAILYAKDKGVRIASNSWGTSSYSQALYDAISSFGQSGGLFIAAAGNSSKNNDFFPTYPASYDLSNIISVAATDKNDALASSSNYGPTSVDLAAPGVDIYSTSTIGYQMLSGTSFAAPHVAGVAALVLSRIPNISVADLKRVILDNVDPVASLSGKMVSGGRLNARKAMGVAEIDWLSFSPASGSIVPNADQNISIAANAQYLLRGIYNADMVISSNDPDENPVTIPVTLNVIADYDNDGYTSDMDCNDDNPLEHPDQVWYLDADDDGYSDGTVNTSSCARPAGYKAASELIATSGDCDDNNSSVVLYSWYPDVDVDGYGNPAVFLQQCIQPAGYVLNNTDCYDYDANIYPGGPTVRITSTIPMYFSSLQSAYDAIGDGKTIQGKSCILTEELVFNLNKSVVVEGGYDCGYTAITEKTIINGSIIINDGTVIAGDIELR